MERSDLGRGEFDTSIGALARRLAAAPSALGAFYYCGYALEFNGRSFLLPASATIARDYDVLTQGIIAKSLVDSLGTGLSPLESDALKLYLEGSSYEDMAVDLGCDTKTIDNALQRVKRKILAHQKEREVLL